MLLEDISDDDSSEDEFDAVDKLINNFEEGSDDEKPSIE